VLTIDKEILPDCQAKLTVTVSPERLQKELQAAAARISKQVNIPGFRRGKAPYHIVVRYYGEEVIFNEALEPLGQAVYTEALEESGLDPYAPGALDDVTREPLTLVFTIPLAPEVKLGAYRDVRIPYKSEKITKKEIEQALEELREQQATLEPVERAVEWEDVATLDIVGTEVEKPSKGGKGKAVQAEAGETAEDSAAIDRKDVKVLIGQKATYPVPGFAENIVGMAVDQTRSFEVAVPAKSKDAPEELRGKTFHFEVTCHEVHSRDVPQLDDEFASSVGDYQDLADLRAKLKDELEKRSEEAARSEYIDKIFEHLTESVVEISYPPIMLEHQLDGVVDDFEQSLERQGLKLDDYLKLNNLTKEALRGDFTDIAKGQLIHGLVLGEVSQAENLTVSEEEIEDDVQTQLLRFGAQAAMAKQLFSSPEIRRSLGNHRLMEKTLDRLVQIARGEAPPLEPAAPAEAAPSAESDEVGPAETSDEVPTESAAQ
jgi:trigger factor